MFNYIWPISLIVLANVFYQICTKSVPSKMNPLASLTVTYALGAIAPFVLGISIVGLEVGYIYAFKAGWPVSIAQIIQSVILAIILIFVGYLLYHEAITWNKVVGILVCLCGLGLINWK